MAYEIRIAYACNDLARARKAIQDIIGYDVVDSTNLVAVSCFDTEQEAEDERDRLNQAEKDEFKVGDTVSITDLRDNVVLFPKATIEKLEIEDGKFVASFAEPSICFRCSTRCLKKVP